MKHKIEIKEFDDYTISTIIASSSSDNKSLAVVVSVSTKDVWFTVHQFQQDTSYDNLESAIKAYNEI